METNYLDSQEEDIIASFNGSYRKVLNPTNESSFESTNKQASSEKKKTNKLNKASTLKEQHKLDKEQGVARISIDKSIDLKIREAILEEYRLTGNKITIKQYVENCILESMSK